MSLVQSWRGLAAAALAMAATLALTACIVVPGAFQSTLDVRRDGQFTFTYEGQIHLMALSQLAKMVDQAEAEEQFVQQTCYDDEEFEERPCTEEEVADQRRQWEEQAAARKADAERDSAMMEAMLGGIDPTDPQAAEELAQRLRRQEGWKRVDYRGDGLFEVQFALTSRLGHDFCFPTFERFPMSNSFVIMNLRQGNSVRIEAPGFATQGASANPMQGMMAGMAGVFGAASAAESASEMPKLPEIDGTFRVTTDGRILANNTEEGPAAGDGGQILEWKVNRRTQAAPMALIGLDG